MSQYTASTAEAEKMSAQVKEASGHTALSQQVFMLHESIDELTLVLDGTLGETAEDPGPQPEHEKVISTRLSVAQANLEAGIKRLQIFRERLEKLVDQI